MEITFDNLPQAVSQLNEKLDRVEKILLTESLKQPEEDKLLTTSEAADFLNLSTATVYGLIHKGDIPSFKPPGSKRVYFTRSSLMEFIKSSRRRTNAEIKADVDRVKTKKPGL